LHQRYVRFSDPGFVNGNVVQLYFKYEGVPQGAMKLEIFRDEENEPTNTQYVSLADGEANKDDTSLQDYSGVVQHVYNGIEEKATKVVRVNFICEGKTGNCATVRRVTVTPTSNTGSVSQGTVIRASCAAYLAANPGATDGIYDIDPDGASGPLSPFPVYCDMTTDGGGWTRVVNIKSGSVFHADNAAAVGDVSDVNAAAKLSDAMINTLSTVGYWRYECGASFRAFVRNDSNIWTSAKWNAYNWSVDRNKDLIFECAANRPGYVFADWPACAVGHSDYAAQGGAGEGTGCFVDLEGWSRDGFLWAK
jgi:hypothetical protein